MDYSAGLPSPQIFRLWAGIAAVGAALERRVWTKTRRSALFPNLYTLLVAPPAVGKSQAINPISKLWYETRKLKVAPDDMTKASLIDALSASERQILNGQTLMSYSSMAVACSELGVLLPANDQDYLSVLNHIFDCPMNYRQSRRSLGKEIEIPFPQLNILAGTQPGFMADIFPERAWSGGFTSRLIMIYSGETPYVDLFEEQQEDYQLWQNCLDGLVEMADMIGEAHWTSAAKTELTDWAKAGCPPEPKHSKLEHYNKRRILHLVKLSLIAAVSRTRDISIDLEDVVRARGWLFQAEKVMPDIFRQMVGRSDAQVLEELHMACWREYGSSHTPITQEFIYDFLQRQVTSDKIDKIFQVAEKAGMIARVAGTENQFLPRHKTKHGLE